MNAPRREQPLILLVDDEQAALDETSAMLTATGFVCECCSSAARALDLAESLLPDLILSDTSLPGESVREMFERVQRHEFLAGVPIMFLSSGQIPDIIRRSDGAGGTYYLRKPPAPEVLIGLIERALGIARAIGI
jgi:CheY-like chemotaxis protein